MDDIVNKLSEIENKIKYYYTFKLNNSIINPLLNNDIYEIILNNSKIINELHKIHEELLIEYIIKYYNI
jgi:hypothetical protein